MKNKYLFALVLALGCSSLQAQKKKSHPLPAALVQLHQQVDQSSQASPLLKVRPLIGISSSVNPHRHSVSANYIQSVIAAGGIPTLIPATTDVETLRQLVAQLDGIVLTGGEDIDPAYYGQKPHAQLEEVNQTRDAADLMILKLATDRNVPVLGVCRGLQLMNVAFGGTLHQDLPSQHPSTTVHRQSGEDATAFHAVSVVPHTQLAQLLGTGELQVNSLHHQAIDSLAPTFRATAWSNDSLVEAIEAYPIRPLMAVQFHPEIRTAQGDATQRKLFEFLVQKADTYRRAKEIHRRILSIDTHTDTPLWFSDGYGLGLRKRNCVSLQKMEEGGLDAQFLAAWIGQGKRDEESSRKAVEKITRLIQATYDEVARYPEYAEVARTEADLVRLKREGKKAFFIGIENGYGIGKDLNNIRRFKEMGVNYITLCHSYDNDICHSSTHTEDASLGLTSFGRQVVKEMNKLGILIDISHASEGTFWDVMKLSKHPVIASHSSARALCDHDRNLTDAQLRALAQNGGVAQLCLLNAYLRKDKPREANVCDAANHLDHMIKVAGIDHVGIGSDFDGGGGILGCQGDNDFINLTMQLLEKDYTEEDLRKIWGGNLLRVLNTVQKGR